MFLFRTWLRQLTSRISAASARSHRRKVRRPAGPVRLQVEHLEERVMPDNNANVWSGATADWATPTDWSLGHTPTATEDVVINSGVVTHSSGTDIINTLTVGSGAQLIINGVSMIIAAASTGPQISDSGTISVGDSVNAGSLYVNATSGSITGTGQIGFGYNTGNNFGQYTSGQTFTIGSGITVGGDSGTVGNPSGTLNNQGTIEANTYQTTHSPGNQVTVNLGNGVNTGTIEASIGETLDVYGSWTNQGTISATSTAPSSSFPNGTTLVLGHNSDAWSNTGTISVSTPSGAAAATVDLGGDFTQAGLGTFTRDAGSTVNITGTLSGGLTLDATTGSWNLGDPSNANYTGKLSGGTFSASGGATLYATFSSALDGVTLDSTLDLATYNNTVRVTNGLTLNNVTLDLGNPSNNSTASEFIFTGTQTLGGTGTLNFGFLNNTLFTSSSTTLTIGSGITIQGQTGQIYGNGPVVNDGTIDANTSGHTITIDPPTFTNNGTVEATNGGSLSVAFGTGSNTTTVQASGGGNLSVTGGDGTNTYSGFGNLSISGGGTLSINRGNANPWENTASITVTNSTVDLGGTFTQANLNAGSGTFSHSGSTVNLTGTLTGGLTLDSSTGSWNLGDPSNANYTGKLSGGTFSASGGATLYATFSSALDGVTLDSTLDLATYNNTVRVTNGLTLNNVTLDLGNPSNNSTASEFIFTGTQTLGGTGTLNFGFLNNTLFTSSSTTLTIGSGITVQGQTGDLDIGSSATLVNDGTIDANTSGHTVTINGAGTFTNNGTIEGTSGGKVSFNIPALTNFIATTLTGGTWTVTGGGIIDGLTAGINDLGNGTSLTVDGANSHFYSVINTTNNALANLSSIESGSTFTLTNGASLTATASTLTNAGTLTLGPAATLTVIGNFTQTSAGTLDEQIAGTKTSGQYGQLVDPVSGGGTPTASLAGTFNLSLLGGFTPTFGDSYPIISFGSITGGFTTTNDLSPYFFAEQNTTTSPNTFSLVVSGIGVTATADSGTGSLRQAITDVNTANLSGGASIFFAIPTSGPGYNATTGVWTIQPTTGLPAITALGVVVNATTQPGYSGTPIIALDGSTAGGTGLVLTGKGPVVFGLAFNNFNIGLEVANTGGDSSLGYNTFTDDSTGIALSGSGGSNNVYSNTLTASGGTTGVLLDGSGNNSVFSNVISDYGTGVVLSGPENVDSVYSNTISASGGTETGVALGGSGGANTIFNNTASGLAYGLYGLNQTGQGNTIDSNNFSNSTAFAVELGGDTSFQIYSNTETGSANGILLANMTGLSLGQRAARPS